MRSRLIGVLIVLVLVTLIANAQYGRHLDAETSSFDRATYFYDMRAPYPDAYPLLEPVKNVYQVPAAGIRLACVRSVPDSGFRAGVLTSIWRNHRAVHALSKFLNRCAAMHQLTDMEILIRRFYGGIADTITENLTGDTTVVRGWVNLSGLEGSPFLPLDEYSNQYTSLVNGNRSSDLTTYIRSQKTFPRIEFRDSIEVWVRSPAGSAFNDYGGPLGMQMVPTQNSIYHSVDALLVPAASDLYGRRVHIQVREFIPRNYDCAMLGYTQTGGRKGFVWYTSYATGPCYTIASNAPWKTSSPYGIDYRQFPDNNNTYAHLEEDGAFYLGYGDAGKPIFTTLHGAHSSGASTVRIAKPDADKGLAEYFPLLPPNIGHRQNATMFNIRQAANPASGGGAFACLTSAVEDCTDYWKVSLITIVEEVLSTLNANYDDGDEVIIVTNGKGVITGTEDGVGGNANGFYSYNSDLNANWQTMLSNPYTDVTADSVLWRISGDSAYIGQAARGYSASRVWSPSVDNPAVLPFRKGEICSYASFKYKPAHASVDQSVLTRKCFATTVYVTEDVGYYSSAPVLRDTVYADLVTAIDNDNSGTTSADWDSLARPSRSAAGAGRDTVGSGLGSVTNHTIDWQPISLNYSGSGKVSTSRLHMNFPTDDFVWNVGGQHKEISRIWVEWFAEGTQWNSEWLCSDTFPVDSSYLAVVRTSLPVNTSHVTQSLRFLRNDSLGGIKFSMYDYPDDYFARIAVTLPDSVLQQGLYTNLAIRWGTYDVRRIFPAVPFSGNSIVRLNVADAAYPDVMLRPKMVIEYTLSAGNVPDTVNVSFTDDRSSSNWIKDAFVIDGSSTTQSGSIQVRIDANTTGTRNRKGLLSLTQAARDSLKGKTAVSAVCSVFVNSVSSIAGDQLKLYVIADNDSSVMWAEPTADVSALKRDVTNNLNWPGGRTLGPTTFASPFATYTVDSLVQNNWFVFSVLPAIQSMCSTSVADSLRDGILWELTDDNDGTAGNIRFAAEEDGSTNAATAQYSDNSRLDARFFIRYVTP